MIVFAEHAWLPGGIVKDVSIEITDGLFARVSPDSSREGAPLLSGLVLPGFANAHSHAFHRALRGRTHDGRGSFWTWRERMYAVAAVLDPDQYLRLATAAYAEMALAGVTSVGEFHYLHHAPGGARYAEPNVMASALREAARSAGIRLTLLDTCYLAGGLSAQGHLPVYDVQRRFCDGDVDSWSARVAELAAGWSGDPQAVVGAAIHSVRAVPKEALSAVAAVDGPLHAHVSEQLAENEACQDFYGLSPVSLLHEQGALGPAMTAVHATHLDRNDVGLLAADGAGVCFCPGTEADLADGIGPARQLRDAGVLLSLGSDQHATLDLLGEARGLEMHERLESGQRGRFTIAELTEALTVDGQRSIGWSDAGQIAVGHRADLVSVRLDSVRTAGSLPEQAVLSASAGDVDTVITDGVVVVEAGRHRLGDVGRLLCDAIEPLWADR